MTNPTRNILIFVILFYNAVTIPLRIAFRDLWDDHPGFIVFCYAMDYFTDALLWLDILVNFTTPYYDYGIIVTGNPPPQHHILARTTRTYISTHTTHTHTHTHTHTQILS